MRSTNSGVSAIIDPVGRVVGHTETFKEQALSADAAWVRAWTPYGFWGDIPWWLITVVTLALAFVPRRLLRGGSAERPASQPARASSDS